MPEWVLRAAFDEVALRAISVQLGGSALAARNTVETCLRFLQERAGATYEGQAVHLNLLVDLSLQERDGSKPFVDELTRFDWHALLGSGITTGMLLDQSGRLSEIVQLPPPIGHNLNALRPDVFSAIGDLTILEGRRRALSLTRSGEILVFQGGQLRLIHRNGSWRGMPFEAIQGIAWDPDARISKTVKKAVLASVIDACLGHHGAAIGIVSRGHLRDFMASQTVREDDLWPDNVRASLFPVAKFQDLPRRLRLEMLSMDGATVLDYQGTILAAGAIVKVPGGSLGGGRLAAVKALAKYGAAIKVSQDGPAKIYARPKNRRTEPPEIAALG